MGRLFRRLRSLAQRAGADADLREEMETHRALRQAAFEREGMAPVAAEAASRRALGNMALAADDARDVWALRLVDSLWQDVRAAVRGLRKSPVFTLVAVGTLALGIGANTALFSIFNSLLLRPLPVHDPASLALLSQGSWTYPIWKEIERLEGSVFDGTIAWAEQQFDLANGGRTDLVDGAFVSGGFFDVLDVSAARGRLLTRADDDAAPDGPVAVISHALWQRHFNGAEDVVGRQLTLQRVPFTVVGVMPAGFFGPDVGRRAELLVPFAAEPLIRGSESWLAGRSTWWLEVMVRLRPGQSLAQANDAFRAMQPSIRAATMPDWPEDMRARYLEEPFTLVPASTGKSSLRGRFETPLFAMVVAVALVLLVACANIASLLLARAVSRRRELSVRLALGAARWRLGRLLLTESLLVAAAGAAVGLLFAKWSSALLVGQLATWRGAVFLDLALDWRVLGFTAATACVAAVVAGVAPVLGVKSIAPGEALKDGGRGVAGDRRFAVRGTLVIAQIAVSLLLVVAAGLFLRTFTALNRIHLGFEPASLLVVEVNLQPSAVAPEDRGALLERLNDAVAGAPGVTSAAVSLMTPVTGAGWNNSVGESPAARGDRSRMTWLNATTPGWFETMGVPVLEGRDFAAGDRGGGPNVAVVNETFAQRFLTQGPPVGQTVALSGGGGNRTEYHVVGVVGDAVYRSPREGRVPTMYLPVAQREEIWPTVALTVRAATGQRVAVEREVAAALTRTDPGVSFTFRTFDQLLEATVTQERLVAMLSSFFGGLALLLAGIGVYGIVAHAVRARAAEIGVRVALGAEPRRIVRLVFRGVGVLIASGLALGLAGAIWAARFIETLLFELDARDPWTIAGAVGVLTLVGVVAAWVPARRAARLDPARVLREG